MNRFMAIAVVGLIFMTVIPAIANADSIKWECVTWGEEDAAPEGWGTWNTTFISNGVGRDGQSTATAKISDLDVWGKIYCFTGVSSADVTGSFKYLYINTYDIQGGMKVAISGANDADFYDLTPHLVSGKTGDPLKKRVYYPGPYVFDLSGWKPSSTHADVAIQLIGEGGQGKGFTVNRIFISDYNPMTKSKN